MAVYKDFIRFAAIYMVALAGADDDGCTNEEAAEWNGAADALIAIGERLFARSSSRVMRDLQFEYDRLKEGD